MFNRPYEKLEAKRIIHENPKSLLAGVLIVGITLLYALVNLFLLGMDTLANSVFNFVDNGIFSMHFQYTRVAVAGSVISLLLVIMTALIDVGMKGYALKLKRGQEVAFMNMFDAFSNLLKFLALIFLRGIFVFLWSLLFVIPGIIAAYRYSMSVFIMIDHPEYSALECISESKRMMMGKKGELFVVDLSFFGWNLLDSFISSLILIPLLSIWLTPYVSLTYAAFYEHLIQSKTIGAGDSVPPPPPPPPGWGIPHQ